MPRTQFLSLWVEAVNGEGAQKQRSKHRAAGIGVAASSVNCSSHPVPKASHPGGKAAAQACGRDTMGYQSMAHHHTGMVITVFPGFFLENQHGKEL